MTASTWDRFNPTKPAAGSTKAIPQHKAVADGYACPQSPSAVKVDLGGSTTRGTMVPGLTRGKT